MPSVDVAESREAVGVAALAARIEPRHVAQQDEEVGTGRAWPKSAMEMAPATFFSPVLAVGSSGIGGNSLRASLAHAALDEPPHRLHRMCMAR